MPRKIIREEKERPAYISVDGKVDFTKIFNFQEKQTELLRTVNRNGHPYLQTLAHECLSTGGVRSGKTAGAMMYFIMHYCMHWSGCDLLILRRTFKELESGAIKDFKDFLPEELFNYDSTKHIATLTNGSRVVFGHCQNNRDRDIEQYLGQAYPAIVVDECGQFSPDAWEMLYSRNTHNAGCKPDENGLMPIPAMWGCTNPIGPHYEYYRTKFVEKKPWMAPEDARKDESNGTWWVPEAGEWRCIYDPKEYAMQRSTVLDNPEMLKRDPGIIARLDSMPRAKRDKMLLGLDGHFEGQYFDVWDPEYHVINLRTDPDAIVWQPWQPVWAGQDWGMGHANAIYLFTNAMVKKSIGDDYILKTVCFQELITSGGKSHIELASLLAAKAKLPNGQPVKIKTIYFSHEKFARFGGTHTPAQEYSNALKAVGLPGVVEATRDRVGSASLLYNAMKNGQLVVTDNCYEIILAIPVLMRNPDILDDVLKVESKADDAYDGFRYGFYGYHSTKKKPEIQNIEDRVKELQKRDPVAAHFYRLKMQAELEKRTVTFVQPYQPIWQARSQGNQSVNR